MSKAIMSHKEIVPGRVLYHVYGCSGKSTETDSIEKYIVTSKPYLSYDMWFFDHICQYTSYDGELKEYSTKAALRDNAIFDLSENSNQKPYNLNRLFASYEDAQDFIKELQTGKFSDPFDSEAEKEKQDLMPWFFDECHIPEDFEDCEYIP